jgi:hypothetical protein
MTNANSRFMNTDRACLVNCFSCFFSGILNDLTSGGVKAQNFLFYAVNFFNFYFHIGGDYAFKP